MQLSIEGWMQREPDVKSVAHVKFFETYLYERDLVRPERFPRLCPVAGVFWKRTELYFRDRPAAVPTRSASYEPQSIVANPRIPAGMRDALWSGFHGR